MSPRAWAYVAGGAGEGATMRANRAAFDRRPIVPRMLHGPRPARPLHRRCSARGCLRRCCSRRSARRRWSTATATCEIGAGGGRARRALRLLQPGLLADGGRRGRDGRRRRGGSSSTGPPTSGSSTASWPGPRRAAPGRSWSPSTRRCSAGGRRTSTSGRCRSPRASGSRSTPPTRGSSEIVRERMAAKAAAAAGDQGRRQGHPRRAPVAAVDHPRAPRRPARQPALPRRPARRSRRSSTSTPTRG